MKNFDPSVILFLTASILFFAAGEFFSKRFAQIPSWRIAVIVACAYVIGALLWLPAISKTNTLAITGTMWNVMAAMSTIVIGILVYGEKVSPMAGIGFALGLAAVLVLNLA